MVHLSDLDWNRSGEDAIQDYNKGDVVKAIVLDVDQEKERISLGIKQLGSSPAESASAGGVRKGATVTCEVTEVQENGIEVSVAGTDMTPSSAAPTWPVTAPNSGPSASPLARRSMPASPSSTRTPARSACRSRRWKLPKRRLPWNSTARPTPVHRWATFWVQP
jgi:exosome complex RNA-binding protein Csl4